MSSYMTRGYLLDRFGPRLTVGQLAKVLAIDEGSLRNQLATGACPVPTYKEGARRFASYEAVADYLEASAKQAKKNPGD